MKKTFKFLVVTLFAAALLVACGGGETSGKDAGFKVVVVLDSGGVDDKSFNQSAWEGTLRFIEENGLDSNTASYLSSKDDGSDYVSNLEAASEDAELVIAVGFLFEKALQEVAAKYPDTEYLFIDAGLNPELPNVHSATFAEEEGGYLVGLVAGLRSKEDGSNLVGFIGGVDNNPVINAFQSGYEAGVWATNPDAKIAVEYANSFEDTSKGTALATKIYGEGANIIFHAAGNVGNGVISEALNYEDKFVIGVDRDQYEDGLNKDGRSVILTSMLKSVDVSSFEFLQEFLDNKKIESKHYYFDVKSGGIGAELTEDRNLKAEEIALVKEHIDKIKNDEVTLTKDPVIKNGTTGTRP